MRLLQGGRYQFWQPWRGLPAKIQFLGLVAHADEFGTTATTQIAVVLTAIVVLDIVAAAPLTLSHNH